MSNQRCEACYHTPLPCMGGHAGRMAEAPPETGHTAEVQKESVVDAAEASGDPARVALAGYLSRAEADVARLKAERDAALADIIALVRENAAAVAEARAQVWAEAVAVVEEVWRDEALSLDCHDGLSLVLAALRAAQERQG